ncbi:hypothetical protein [Sphaerisporangium album]|uniref:hypothetical protein n=1 Tax=Sphaerisporangium album TaxID=509200 RepID=UPI0011C02F00|nr:hypothetical protein [Sphaerisporangium album]
MIGEDMHVLLMLVMRRHRVDNWFLLWCLLGLAVWIVGWYWYHHREKWQAQPKQWWQRESGERYRVGYPGGGYQIVWGEYARAVEVAKAESAANEGMEITVTRAGGGGRTEVYVGGEYVRSDY